MMDDLLQIIEEQADVIMRQSERILKLATLLLEKGRSDTGRTGLDY